MSTAPLDARQLRQAFGQFATGVTVVSAAAPDGQPIGMTVNAFTSLSLEPPLLLWCLGRQARDAEVFANASHHVINILAADQQSLSDCFAGKSADRFADVAWTPGLGGAPVLAGCCANIEVTREQVLEGGDHLILISLVLACRIEPARSPLLFHGGRYARLASD